MRCNRVGHLAGQLRRIPLEQVLQRLAGKQDKHDRAKWHTARGIISITGMKFHNWNQGIGGGGAIDLVMHLGQTDFRSAVIWLQNHFPAAGLPQKQCEPLCRHLPLRGNLRLPQRDEGRLAQVIRYLTATRRLPRTIVQRLIKEQTMYADGRSNAVFVMRNDQGRPVGAELRGTTRVSWRGMARGSRKALGYFSVGDARSKAVVICESAIDAISCLVIHPGSLCISTAGACAQPPWIIKLIQPPHRILCGFDNDDAGNQMAERMIRKHPAIQRVRPTLHDWNDDLIASTQTQQPG